MVFCVFVAGIAWMLYWQVWQVRASRQDHLRDVDPGLALLWHRLVGHRFLRAGAACPILRAIINFNAPTPESTAAKS